MSKFPWKSALAGAALFAVAGYAFASQFAPNAGPMLTSGHTQPRPMPPQGATIPHMMGHMNLNHMAIDDSRLDQLAAKNDLNMKGPRFGAKGVPTLPGQEAFGAIQEIVRILEADPSTDWSKVNIAALREHLIDMDEVTMHAAAQSRTIDGGIEFSITGTGRTRPAIKRMVPAHITVLRSLGWRASAEDLPDGVKLTVMESEGQPLGKLKALGFIGIMAQGAHHQAHHLMMAKGEMMPAH